MKRMESRRAADGRSASARHPPLSPLALALMLAYGGAGWANPAAPVVVSGQASVVASGKTLTVTNTPGAIVSWQGFSIAPDELTRFVQQSASSSVLNRVVGADPSRILGQLSSNGRVFLVNPNGIVFGASSRVDVAALAASTLDIADSDFLAGRLRFAGPAGSGSLTQLGTITTPSGGQVLLVAPSVHNAGLVTTPEGEILLAAGHSVQLVDAADPALRVTVSAAGTAVNLAELVARGGRLGIHAGLITQNGTLNADGAALGPGGEVYLRASGSAGSTTSSPSPSPTGSGAGGASALTFGAASRTSANGTVGGRITAQAPGATLQAAGTMEARGSQGAGGSIHLLGGDVRLAGAQLDVSGASAGGTILVGGDYQGANPTIANARSTQVDAASVLTADATASGRGGKVVVWADGASAFAGSISARGGAHGGDGGFVEVSGKATLDFQGTADTRAPLGLTGTLLLDPTDITISNAANGTISAGPTYTGTAASSNLNVTTLQTALASNNVVVDTTSAFAGAGNITVADAVTWAGANSLELKAHNDITVSSGATINATGTGALRLIADQDGNGAGNVAVNANVTTRLGGISISGVNITTPLSVTLRTTGLTDGDGGAMKLTATNAVVTGDLIANGGTASAGAGRNAGAVTINGSTISVAAVVATGSAAAGTSLKGGKGGAIALTATGAVGLTFGLTANGGAGSASNGAGGDAGSIAIANSGAGNVTATTLTASTGAATGSGAAGTAGSISVTNSAGNIQTGSITTTGAAKGNGGSVVLDALGSVTVTVGGAITTSGGTSLGSMAGADAGNVTLRGSTVTMSPGASGGNLVTASGSNALGLAGARGGHAGALSITATAGAVNLGTGGISAVGGNAVAGVGAGGNGGNVTVAATGNVTIGPIGARSGNAFGTGATGGTAGTLDVSGAAVSLGALTTTGGIDGDGGAIAVRASGTLATGAIAASGGTGNTGIAGGAAGTVTLASSGAGVTTGSVTANGGAAGGGGGGGGGAGGNGAPARGGDAASVDIRGAGAMSIGAVQASGGNASGGNAGAAAGGRSGTVTLANTSTTTGAVTVTSLTARVGAANGATTSGAAGRLEVTNNAPTLLQVGAIDTSGQAGGSGGDVRLVSAGNVTASSTIALGGGALAAGTIAAGRDAGSLTVQGVNRMLSGAVTASGTAAVVAGNKDGDAGSIVVTGPAGTVTGSGTLSTAALTASNGAALGATTTGAAGRIVLDGSAITVNGNYTTSGTALGSGGAITLLATDGGITATGRALSAGVGAITLTGTGSVAGSNGISLASATTLTTTSGDIRLLGWGTGTAPGIRIANVGTIVSTATGAIHITGTGGPSAAGVSAHGVHLDAGAIVRSTVDSTIHITGTAGNGDWANFGIRNQGSTVSAVDGAIVMTGYGMGGRGSTNSDNVGIVVNAGGIVQGLGNANVTLTGIGSAASTDRNYGIQIARSGIVSVKDGDLRLEGTGGGTGADNVGVLINVSSGTSGLVRSLGSGAIDVVGTGGVGTDGNIGIAISSGVSKITTAGGAVRLTGTGSGTGANNHGIVLDAGGAIESSGPAAISLTGVGAAGARGIVGTNALSSIGGPLATGPIRLGADAIDLANVRLQSSGALTLEPLTAATPLERGGAAAIGFALGATAMGNLIDGFSSITIGRADGSGAMTVHALTFTDPLTLRAPLGSIAVDGALAGSGDATLRLQAGAIGLAGNVSTIGRSITLDGPVTLGATVLLETTGGGSAPGGAALAVTGRIDGDGGLAARHLTLDAGNAGTVALAAPIGALAPIGGLTVRGASVSMPAVSTGAGGITVDAGGIALYGDLSTGASANAGPIALTGTLTLHESVVLRSAGTGADAALTIAGPIDADLAANRRALTLDAGPTGTVAIGGAVGAARPLGALTVADAASFTLGAVDTLGDVTLRAREAIALTAPIHSSTGRLRVVADAGDLTLGATLGAGASGDAIVLSAGGAFVNTAGAAALDPGAGRWLIFSGDPSADTPGGLTADFKQYAAAGVSTPAVGSGNGLLYRLAPVVAPNLIGGVAKVYDGTTAANLAPANIAANGTVAGDTLVIGGGVATFDTRHAGSGKTVTVTGLTIVGASQGAMPVYGYALSAPDASAAIGTISPAPLAIGARPDSRVYDGGTASTASPSVAGLVAGDSLVALSQTFDVESAGARVLSVSGYTLLDGNGGRNYAVSTATAPGLIMPAMLTITADDKTRTTLDSEPLFTARYGGWVGGDTLAILTGTLQLTTSATSNSPAGSYPIVPRGVAAANYTIGYVDGTLSVTTPPAAAIATPAPQIPPVATPAPLLPPVATPTPLPPPLIPASPASPSLPSPSEATASGGTPALLSGSTSLSASAPLPRLVTQPELAGLEPEGGRGAPPAPCALSVSGQRSCLPVEPTPRGVR